MNAIEIDIQAELGSIPSYATPGSAGMDLYSAVDDVLEFGDRKLIPTGISVAIPEGYVGLVCPRSGLALNNGVGIVNSPGVIDPDYRGEVGVILINHGGWTFEINRGSKIAQLLIVPNPKVVWRPVNALDDTERGAGGFGSSGE